MSPGSHKISSSRTPEPHCPPNAAWLFRGLTLALLLMPGCSSGQKKNWFKKPRTSQQWLDQALEAQAPDERRKGVVGLSESRDGQSDWAMKVFNTIARTDRDPMVRCAAVKAMSPAGGAREVPTVIKLLSGDKFQDVRAASAPVRWEAAQLLQEIVSRGGYEESQRQEIVDMLIDKAKGDTDRNVRLTAIDTLAYFAQNPVPTVLVDIMEAEEDYALQHATELALISLTGHTHHHDAKAWRKWLEETKDPFVAAGLPPEDSAGGERSRWQWPY